MSARRPQGNSSRSSSRRSEGGSTSSSSRSSSSRSKGGDRRSGGPRVAHAGTPPDAEAVITMLGSIPGGGTAAQVARLMNLDRDTARALSGFLRDLVQQGQLLETRPGRYQPSGAGGEHAAVLEDDGKGRLLARLPAGDFVAVDPRMTVGARPGDVCQVMLSEDGQALVTRILRRHGRIVVGALNFRPEGMVFVPDNRREGDLPVLEVPADFEKKYQAGCRVRGILQVDESGNAGVNIDGIIGVGSPDVVDFSYTCLSHDLPGPFPPDVEREAAAFTGELPVENRRDLRKSLIFTIDPETAKDFDDAISLDKREDGGWTLGVHIADVSHYVREDTELNREAAERATSIYLINRVIPMLPETLSNGLCSLVPHKDRYALTVFMQLDKHHRLVNTELCESIIHSKQRLSYEQALAVLEGSDEDLPAPLVQVIREVGDIAQAMRRARERAGALNLYSIEHRFTLDAEGNPSGVVQESTDPSHQLIEECMLLANRAVATWLEQKGFDLTYRVHAPPDNDKMEQFAAIMEAYGIDSSGAHDRFGLQRLLRRLEDEPQAARLVLNFMCLRSFKKAVYAVENIGHYALAFDSYCHFTSPIRRYPDLLVHRIVKRALKLPGYERVEIRREYLDALSRQSSWLEQRAEQAERTLHARKCARYLSGRIGESFPAVVTGASGGGLFVQILETGMDGNIPVRDLGDEFFNYDPERLALIGSRSGRVFGPGAEIDVLVVSADIERSEVVFGLDASAAPRVEKPVGGASISEDLERLSRRSGKPSSSRSRDEKKREDPRSDKRKDKESQRKAKRMDKADRKRKPS